MGSDREHPAATPSRVMSFIASFWSWMQKPVITERGGPAEGLVLVGGMLAVIGVALALIEVFYGR